MAEPLKTSLLLTITDDPDEATAHLLKYGACRLSGALPDGRLDVLRREVRVAAAADTAAGRSYMYSQGANHPYMVTLQSR